MQPQYTQAEFTGQHVYAGIDVALKGRKVAIFLGKSFHKRQSPEGIEDFRGIISRIRRYSCGSLSLRN